MVALILGGILRLLLILEQPKRTYVRSMGVTKRICEVAGKVIFICISAEE